MFVIRCLLATLAVIAGALAWGSAAGYPAWKIAGLAFLAALVLQGLILGYVVFAAIRKARAPQDVLQDDAGKPRDQLVILPR